MPGYFSDVPFAQLRALLLDLGFVEQVLGDRALAFHQAESDTFLTFPRYRPQDKVSMMTISGVRSQLDWHGLMSPDVFDAALRKASA